MAGIEGAHIFEFDLFRLDGAENILTREGTPVRLTPKAFDMLTLLVRNSGHVVKKEELLKEVWRDAFVEEGSLAVNVFALRKALGRTPHGREYIETVPRRGYRFVGDVRSMPVTAAAIGPRTAISTDAVGAVAAMIVVLPMRNLTDSAEMDHISDGFTDILINQLACADSRELSVIARTSAMTYKRGAKTIREIASELQIDYAVESSLRRAGDCLLITVQLVGAERQAYLWTKEYRLEVKELIEIENEVAHAIAGEIRVTLSPGRRSREKVADPAVYELYLKGRYFCNMRTGAGLRRGIEYFEQAIALDPTYAPAQSGLAACWAFSSLLEGKRPGESFPEARAAALRALELDPLLSEAHSTLGLVYAWYEFDWTRGERSFRRALELEPSNVTTHTWYAFFLGSLCRHREASIEIQIAMRLDPLSWAVRAVFAFLEEWAGRGLSAILELEKALELNPRYYFARMLLGYFNMSILRRATEAIAQSSQACEESGRQPDALSALGCVYAEAGMRGEALSILEEMHQSKFYISPFFFARIHAGLGDFDRAFACLDEAFEERFFWLMIMLNDPTLRSLAKDPRYRNLVSRMAFPGVSNAAAW